WSTIDRLLTSIVSKHLALEYPYLDTDDAVGGARFGHSVIDVGTQRMQRHTAFAIPFGTRDFDTVETARTHDLDALGAKTHRVLHCALHGTAEHHALFELLRNAFGNQCRVDFGLAHFFDVEVHRHAHQALQTR